MDKPLAPYLRSVLFDSAVARIGIFDLHQVEKRIMEHTSARRDHGVLLWKALHLALWSNTYGVSA